MISFMERHRDVLPFRMQPRFRGESFYWELPACQPWLFHAPWQDQDDPRGMQENPRYILFPVILFPSGTWMAGRFYPKGTEQEMYDVLKPEEGKKKKCVNICIPPQAFMSFVRDRFSHLAGAYAEQNHAGPLSTGTAEGNAHPASGTPRQHPPGIAGSGAPIPKTGRKLRI